VAVAHGLDHFQIEASALIDALRLDHAALRLEFRNPGVELTDDGINGFGLALRLHDVVALGVNRQPSVLLLDSAKERIDLRKRFDFIAK